MAETPRQILAAWMRARLADMDSVDLRQLAREAVDAHAGDAAVLRDWWRDTAYQVAYTLGTQLCADTRVPATARADGDEGAARAAPKQPWFERLEHVGTHYIRFGDLTRVQLVAYAEERERPALTELRVAGVARALAARLPDDTTTVREHFTEAEIARWDRLLKVTVAAGIPAPARVSPGKATGREVAD